jgi:hypothetical protein
MKNAIYTVNATVSQGLSPDVWLVQGLGVDGLFRLCVRG